MAHPDDDQSYAGPRSYGGGPSWTPKSISRRFRPASRGKTT